MTPQLIDNVTTRRMLGPNVMPVEERCPACESANASTAKFCGECGHRLSGSGNASGGRPLETPVARRTHRCERKQSTVLFTDVSSFTALSQRLDSEDVFDIMERALQLILDEVHGCGGTVNQFLGDGVMALFGESDEQHHALRAVNAALAIQDTLEPLRVEVRRTHGIEFRTRITINSGDVTLGTIGDSLRTDYTAAGRTVSVAAQLLRVAHPGEIVITDQTYRFVDGRILCENLGRVAVDGVTGETEVFSVLGSNARSFHSELVCA